MGASTTRAALSRSILLVCAVATVAASICIYSLKHAHHSQAGFAKLPETLMEARGVLVSGPAEDVAAGLAKDDGAGSPGRRLSLLSGDMGWSFFFPEIIRRRSIGHAGDMLRLKRFLRKVVVDRKRFTAVAMGGSITSDYGGWRGYQGPLLESLLGTDYRPGSRDGWLTTALDWLTEAFLPTSITDAKGKPVDSPPYRLINLGMAATGPNMFQECTGMMYLHELPKEVDLVIIDYAVNYDGMRSQYFAQLDTLVQKIMHRWSTPPAILFVNFFHWCQRDNQCMSPERITSQQFEGGVDNRTWEKLAGTFSDFQDEKFPEYLRAEDSITAVARYYGLPVISIRDALYPLLAGQVSGFNLTEMIPPLDGGRHPSRNWSLTRIPELVISFFQDAIRTLDHDSTMPESHREWEKSIEEGYLQIPPPLMFDPNAEATDKTVTKACYSFEVPTFHRPPKLSAQGWSEMEDSDSKKPKPGLITREPGSVVQFEIDTTAKDMMDVTRTNSSVVSEAKAQVEVTFLQSYERMGEAVFECVSGCRCRNGTMLGTTENRYSVPATMTFKVSKSRRCGIQITSRAGKGGNKFKLLGVSVKVTAKLCSYAV